MRIHAQNRATRSAFQLLDDMQENAVKPDVHTYDFALGSCNSRKKWENIITLLDAMQVDGVQLNSSCYRTVMHGLSYSQYHERCYDLYVQMRENGISPEEHHLCDLLRALFGEEGQPRDKEKAMQTFQSLVEDTSVKFSEVHFDIAISMCEKEGRWREILSLATAMGGRGIIPHSMTCNAVLKACVQLGKWEDRIAYLTVLTACERARKWDEVLKLYADIEERFPSFVNPDMRLPTIAALCEVGREDEARPQLLPRKALYRESFGSALARQQSRRRGNDPIVLDARRLSRQVAGIMMRCALEDSAKSADATAARAAKPMALAGFTPTGLKDIFIAVNAADLEDDQPLSNSTAEALLSVAREMLGADAELECQQTPFPAEDTVPETEGAAASDSSTSAILFDSLSLQVTSQKLTQHLRGAGLSSLHSVLEQLGILTFHCLGQLNEEELQEICGRLRAAGFGPGHACAFRNLCHSARGAREDADVSSADVPTSVTKLSPKLQLSLQNSGLVQIQMVLAQSGVRSCRCLAGMTSEELQEVRAALTAFMDLQHDTAKAWQHKSAQMPEVVESETPDKRDAAHSAEERPGKCRRLEAVAVDNVDRFLEILQTFKGKVLSDAQIISDWLNGVNFGFMKLVLQPLLTHVQSAFTSEDSVEEELRSALQATVRKVPQEREEKAQDETPPRPRLPVKCVKGDGELRLTRQRIEKTLCHSKAIQAEIVKYRDKVSGKLVEARVPTTLLALLRLRASCSGKPLSDQKLARMAVDVMEENAFDPVPTRSMGYCV
eukprot:g28940.t1